MMPKGRDGHWHYDDCKATLNTDPACSCVNSMAKQISMLAEQIRYLMAQNRHQQKVIDNGNR